MKDYFTSQAKKFAKKFKNFERPHFEEDPSCDIHPLFQAYAHIIEFVTPLAFMMLDQPKLKKQCKTILELEQTYGIGSSYTPIYESYFNMWMLFDFQCGNAVLADFAIEFAKALKLDQDLINAIEALKESHAGVYIHQGFQNEKVLLCDLITRQIHPTVVVSPYQGQKDQIWLIRLAPAGMENVAITSPYIIKSKAQDWLDYFASHDITPSDSSRYKSYMKENQLYWFQYLLQNHHSIYDSYILINGCPKILYEAQSANF